MSNFFSPPAHLCVVTYMTEISLHLTLSNQSHSLTQVLGNLFDSRLTNFNTAAIIDNT